MVPDAVVLPVPDIKVPDMPFFSMPKLSMPKTDVPSPPTFNVPTHPPPKPAASLSSSVPEFKVPDAAPKFDMPKVVDPLFSMPKFDIPNMPTFALPRWMYRNLKVPAMQKFDMPAAPPVAYNLNVPKFNVPMKSSSPTAVVADKILEPQEVHGTLHMSVIEMRCSLKWSMVSTQVKWHHLHKSIT